MENGKSELIDDFISRRGRPFSAYLVLEGSKVSYQFPPRKAAADATKFPVEPGVVGVCPRHKVNIVESETHYLPEEGSSGCSIFIAREVSKRVMTREEAKQLIESNEVGPFDDFKSKKTGNPFTSFLYLKKNESIGYKFAKKS